MKPIRGIELGANCTDALDAVAFRDAQPAEAKGPVTTEHRLFPDAKLFHPSDPEIPLSFDSSFRAGMMQAFKQSGLDVQIDFNHLSAGGVFNRPSIQDGAAAGWVTDLVDKGQQGLWAKVQWTDLGLNAVRSREYRYLSPEFSFSRFDKNTGAQVPEPRLLAVALTNRPFLENQQQVAASDITPATGTNGDITMSEVKTAVDAGGDAALRDELEQLKKKLSLSEQEKAIHVKALAEVQKAQRMEVVEEAAKQGRVTPAMRESVEKYADACNSIDDLRKFLSSLPVQVRSKAIGADPEVSKSEAKPTLSADDMAAAKFFDLNTEDMATFGEWDTVNLKREFKKAGVN